MMSESSSEVVIELAEEFVERYRRGQRPSVREYAERYPHLAGEIREVFPAIAMMENIAPDEESPAGSEAFDDSHVPPAGLEQLGDFRILREVGHGGMGIVYEAEQVSLGRHVALKVLPQTARLSARNRHRFEREARAAAKLHHTNIVPVFGIGEQAGLCYYVMQFIQGLGLDAVLKELRRLRAGGGPSGTATVGEPPTSPGREACVAEIARSLMTGTFERIRRTSGDDEGGWRREDGGERERRTLNIDHRTLNDSAGAVSASDPPRATSHEQRTTDHGPPSLPQFAATTAAQLSDTFRLSGSVTLPGRSGLAPAGRQPPGKQTFWQSVAHIGSQVAAALQYAHDQGILHRDIKPSNLLLDLRGTVWVTDFGLAKVEDQQNITHTGDILGTLRYMPPEAFDGRSDVRSDIYSLGLTLYELLALKPAFDVKDRHKLIREVTNSEPPRLEKLVPEIPRDLATVVHKAIDREPARRYQSARELADELGRFLADEPVRARPVGVAERVGRWCRRNPSLAALTAASVLLLAGVAGVSTVSAIRIAHARDEAIQAQGNEADERQRAEHNAEESRQRLVDVHVASGMRLVEQGDPHGALPSLVEALRLDETDPARAENHRLRLAAAVDRSAKLVALWAAEERAFRVVFCPDGRHVATSGAAGLDVREVATGESVFVIARGTPLHDFAFSPDGRRVATAGQDGTARVWELATGQPVTGVLRHNAVVNSIRFDSEGGRVVTTSDDQTARVWDPATGELLRSYPHARSVQSAVFSPDGLRLVTASAGDLRVWDANDGRQVFPTIGVDLSTRPLEIAFSSDGSRIIAAGGERTVRTWDAATGRPLAQIGPAGWSQLSPDGRRTVAYSSAVQVWDVATGSPVTPPLSEIRSAIAAAFSPRGDRLLAAGWDGRVRVWDVATAAPLAGPLHHVAAVVSAAFSPDGRLVVTLDRRGTVRVWDLAGTAHESRPLEDDWVAFVAVSPDGRWVINEHGGPWGCAWLWDASTGRLVATLRDGPRKLGDGVGGTLLWAAFSPGDGRRVVTVFDHGSARIWDSATGTPVTEPLRHSGIARRTVFHPDGSLKVTALISHAEFSPDGRQLVTASEDKTVRVWDAATGELLREIPHDRAVLYATYSPDGRRLLTTTADALERWESFGSQMFPVIPTGVTETRVWDAATARPLTPPLRYSGTVMRAAFSPDGKAFLTLATSQLMTSLEPWRAQGGEVQVWETASGRPLSPPLVHPQEVIHAALSPDGRLLATGGFEGTIRLWEIPAGKPLLTLTGHAGLLTQVVFSPNGRQLLSASLDGLARVWEPATGQLVAVFPHERGIYRAAFAASGESVVTGCVDSSVHRWPLTAERRAADDWGLLAEALAPGRGVGSGRAVNPPEPVGAWRNIHAKHSREFAVTIPEQFVWHRRALADAVANKAWPAALVQLDSLLALDPANWRDCLARARLLGRLERWDEAEAEFTRAIERHSDNPQVWIARGSFLLGRGRREEAAVDLERTIEMQKSSGLEAALSEFWLAGPYAEDLRTAQPAEAQVDPTQAIPLPSDAEISSSDNAQQRPGRSEASGSLAHWQGAAAGPSGFLDLGTYFSQAEHLSAYALAYVYARADQDVTIWSGSDDDLRLWLNGELIHEHPYSRPPFPDQDRVPARLKRGWNTVLAKVVNRAGRHGLFLRLSADPADLAAALADRRRWDEALSQFGRAIEQRRGAPGEAAVRSQRALLHARLGHWEEAHDDYTRGLELEPENHVWSYHRAPLRLKMGDREGYARECREMLARFRATQHPVVGERTVKNCVVLREAVDDPAVLVELADRAVAGTEHSNLYPYFQSIKGFAEYRAGRFEQSVSWLLKSDEGLTNPPCKAMTQLFLSMAYHKLGRAEEAHTTFDRATELINRQMPKKDSGDLGLGWHDWIRCEAVAHEADALIRGGTPGSP